MAENESEFVFTEFEMPASDTLNALVYALKNSPEFEITKIDAEARLLYCNAVKTMVSWGNRFALKIDEASKDRTRITMLVRAQDNVNKAAQNLFMSRILELTDNELRKYGYRAGAMRAHHTKTSEQ